MARFKFFLTTICILFLFVGLFSSQAFASFTENHNMVAPTFIIDYDGQLLSVQDILIKDEYYDVTFVEGTCENLFSDNGEYSLIFNTGEDATAAAQILLDQVLLPDFDTSPNMIYGIEDSRVGGILTPYGGIFLGDNGSYYTYTAISLNWNQDIESEAIDGVYTGLFFSDLNTLNNESYVYAVWTEANPVPAPGAVLLLGSGLLGLTGVCRRQRK